MNRIKNIMSICATVSVQPQDSPFPWMHFSLAEIDTLLKGLALPSYRPRQLLLDSLDGVVDGEPPEMPGLLRPVTDEEQAYIKEYHICPYRWLVELAPGCVQIPYTRHTAYLFQPEEDALVTALLCLQRQNLHFSSELASVIAAFWIRMTPLERFRINGVTLNDPYSSLLKIDNS